MLCGITIYDNYATVCVVVMKLASDFQGRRKCLLGGGGRGTH